VTQFDTPACERTEEGVACGHLAKFEVGEAGTLACSACVGAVVDSQGGRAWVVRITD